MNFQSNGPHGKGIQRLNNKLLKPKRFNLNIMSVRSGEAIPEWIHLNQEQKILDSSIYLIFLPPF